MLKCKACTTSALSKSELLNHYKLKHVHFGLTSRYPCTYLTCPYSFKTWNALIVHHNRVHSTQVSQKPTALSVFCCHLCACKDLATEITYFSHITTHLKRNESVSCMFLGCDFKTNIYGTFKSHRSRHHTPHALTDFKPSIVRTTRLAPPTDAPLSDREEDDSDEVSGVCSDVNAQPRELAGLIEQQLAAALLKLEYLVHVPGTAIDEFLQELHHLISSPTIPLSSSIVSDIFQSNNIHIDSVANLATFQTLLATFIVKSD